MVKASCSGAWGHCSGRRRATRWETTVEFKTASEIPCLLNPNGLREVVGGGPFCVAPGQVTDDTELALALARSLAEKGAYDADDVARRYLLVPLGAR